MIKLRVPLVTVPSNEKSVDVNPERVNVNSTEDKLPVPAATVTENLVVLMVDVLPVEGAGHCAGKVETYVATPVGLPVEVFQVCTK